MSFGVFLVHRGRDGCFRTGDDNSDFFLIPGTTRSTGGIDGLNIGLKLKGRFKE